MRPRRSHTVSPSELGPILAVVRRELGLTLRAAAEQLGTNFRHLHRAEHHSERHLDFALDMLSRYAAIISDQMIQEPQVEVVLSRQMIPFIDTVREVARAPRRLRVADAVRASGGPIHRTEDPGVLETEFGPTRVSISLDRPVASITFPGCPQRWHEAEPGEPEDEFYRRVLTIATSTNRPTPTDT